MYLHNEADFISLGVQRLCIMGDPISPGWGGWEGKLSRPETGPLRTLGQSLPSLAHCPFLFHQVLVILRPSEVRILSGDPDTEDGKPRMVSGRSLGDGE